MGGHLSRATTRREPQCGVRPRDFTRSGSIREKSGRYHPFRPSPRPGVSTYSQPDRFISLLARFENSPAQSPGGGYHPPGRPPCNDHDRAGQVLTGSIEHGDGHRPARGLPGKGSGVVRRFRGVLVGCPGIRAADGPSLPPVPRGALLGFSRFTRCGPPAGHTVHEVRAPSRLSGSDTLPDCVTRLGSRLPTSDFRLSPRRQALSRSRIAVSGARRGAKTCDKPNEYSRSLVLRI